MIRITRLVILFCRRLHYVLFGRCVTVHTQAVAKFREIGSGGINLSGLPVFTRRWTISGRTSHSSINSRRTHNSNWNTLSSPPLSGSSRRSPLSSAWSPPLQDNNQNRSDRKFRKPDRGPYPPVWLYVAYFRFLPTCHWIGSLYRTSVNMRSSSHAGADLCHGFCFLAEKEQ